MGRLFWKFFAIFWFAQVVTAAGVGFMMWIQHAQAPGPAMFGGGPPPPGFGEPFHRPPLPLRPERLPIPLAPILAGSVVSLVFAALLAWYFAKPIRSLRAAFESVAGGKLDTRVGAAMGRRHDELADLGSDFDRMADRLQSLMEAQRRLLHDVSHELRSPLARLQAAADLMRQQPGRGAELIERIERDTARMDCLVGELLTLARLDAGMAGVPDEEVDLGEIVADVGEDARFEAEAKHCALEVEVERAMPLRGSRELLHRAVENIVRNALRHVPPAGGRIAVGARAAGGRLRVTVADNGPGVLEDDLAAIFDPFFRSGAGGATAGYGLGLAIARRVAVAHGGTVSAANRPQGGLLVTIDLPAA